MAIQPIRTAALLEVNGEEQQFPEVRITPLDQVAFERTGRARGWSIETHQLTFLFFCTWHSLKRRGLYTGTYDEFLEAALVVREHEEEDEETEDEAGPTQPGA